MVVADDGGFVTCLGRGMRTGRLPVVARSMIDAAFEESARVGRVDARIAMCGGVFEVLKRVLTAGHRLAREDFEAAALLAPFVEPVLVAALKDNVDFVFETQRAMSLRRLRRTDRQTTWTLRQYSIAVDTARHLVLMLIPAGQMRLAEGMPASEVITLGGFSTFTGDLGGIAATACFAAHVGPGALPGYIERWHEADAMPALVEPLTGLIALASAYPDLLVDVLAVLRDRRPPAFHGFDAPLSGGFADITIDMLTTVDAVDDSINALRYSVAESIAAQGGPIPGAEPEHLVNGLIANMHVHWVGDAVGLSQVPAVAAWAARLKPSDLYLPAAYLSEYRTGLSVEGVRRCLSDIVRWEGRDLPVMRDGPKVGRNDPCPCGSGRKYKRCCIGQ